MHDSAMQGTQTYLGWNLLGDSGSTSCRLDHLAVTAIAFFISISVAVLSPYPALGDAGRKVGRGVVVDVVDRIEINHVMDHNGAVALDQVIYWDYSPGLAAFVVIDWRTLKNFSQVPYRRGLLYVSEFHDTRDSCRRKIVAGEVIETWTTYDAENANQEICDRNERRGLTRPEKRKAVK